MVLFSYIKSSVLALCSYWFQQRCRCPVCQVGRGTCASALSPPACRSSSWFRVWRSPFMCCCCRPLSWGLSSSSLPSCWSSMGWSSCSASCLYWPFQGEHLSTSGGLSPIRACSPPFCSSVQVSCLLKRKHQQKTACNICLLVTKVEILWWASSLSETNSRRTEDGGVGDKCKTYICITFVFVNKYLFSGFFYIKEFYIIFSS